MNSVAIRVEGLGKQYRLGKFERYRTLRESIANGLRAPARAAREMIQGSGSPQESTNSIWALKDISMEVMRGEIVGIIGRNGARKSTLLKILSRVTQPTEGLADLYGRVASLLEVGTGFHPELTGRENIFLNGSILGMRGTEIARNFDEIVAFAELERFLDTPVKRYSSGMYLRLAFAVAAHLVPEVLIIDEVLAVGDAAFQKKCLGKMGEVAQDGRTVILVSHNMAAIQALCTRALLIDGGRLVCTGSADTVVGAYLRSAFNETLDAYITLETHARRRRGSVPLLQGVTLRNGAGAPTCVFAPTDSLVVDIEVASMSPIRQPVAGIGVDNSLGIRVFSATTMWSRLKWERLDGHSTVRCSVSRLNLMPGRYLLSVSAGAFHSPVQDLIEHAISFEVEPGDHFGNGRSPGPEHGVVLADSSWAVHESSRGP